MGNIFSVLDGTILQILLFLYKILFQNFGLAIIALTFLIRAALLPILLPATKAQKKMTDLKPKIDELKEKHSEDKKKFQEEQLKLYQEHGINPLSGCLPNIVQIIILLSLYSVLNKYLGGNEKINGQAVNTLFLWLNLAKPDPTFILPIIAGITQLFLSKMMLPTKALSINKADTKKEKKEKQDFAETMVEVQGQMVYMMPIMTTVISVSFPSGLALYWVVGNIFTIVQQYFVSGLGGLTDLMFWKNKKTNKQ
ncbi:MAG: YidC/Oxa1 family membrane protein insertase [bacterium]|nr:YidC/Oxa1 family membrane protein insertase [bacterium]